MICCDVWLAELGAARRLLAAAVIDLDRQKKGPCRSKIARAEEMLAEIADSIRRRSLHTLVMGSYLRHEAERSGEESPMQRLARRRETELRTKGYRMLNPSEKLKRGDEIRWGGKWMPIKWGYYSEIDAFASDCAEVYYRRPESDAPPSD